MLWHQLKCKLILKNSIRSLIQITIYKLITKKNSNKKNVVEGQTNIKHAMNISFLNTIMCYIKSRKRNKTTKLVQQKSWKSTANNECAINKCGLHIALNVL